VNDDAFDARLAPIFITPLNEKGAVEPAAPAAVIPAQAAAPVLFDSQAAAAAMLTGVDWRTVQLSSGSRLRLLTYRTANPAGPALLQAGRLLDDQDNLLKNFLAWIITLSGSSILLLGVASWWLSGRSLGPAEKAWDQQQAFISNASHELRTPLTFIQATAEVALRDHPAPKQKEYLDNILEEIHYLNGMVDDLLLLARRDARRLNLKREAVELPGLFTEIQRQVANRAAEQDITVALGECKQSVWADAARLRQVLLILIDNAIRYTPSGGAVCLEASRHGRLDTIAVSDNGAGIPAEFVPHLFERFYQAPQPETDQSRSNGLGLSIAKALVDAMGGGIAIESQLGKGTRVTVELPAAG
jgi:signal transduction histidine kinase